MDSEIPRRTNIEKYDVAEAKIREAMIAIEQMPPHPILTDAVSYLEKAKNRVSDYIDKNLGK